MAKSKYINGFALLAAFLATVAAWPLARPAGAEEGLAVLESRAAVIYYTQGLDQAALGVQAALPSLLAQVEGALGLAPRPRPTVVLIGSHGRFVRMAGGEFFSAYAIPSQQVMVFDYSQALKAPENFVPTLLHELTHLALGQNIAPENLPRWFDEGVAIWASQGASELVGGSVRALLPRAARSGELIPFPRLEKYFPDSFQNLTLAYEQSYSMVNFLEGRFGPGFVRLMLAKLKNGAGFDDTLASLTGREAEKVFELWRQELDDSYAFWELFAANLYELLFFVAAILVVAAYVKVRLGRRRAEMEGDESVFLP